MWMRNNLTAGRLREVLDYDNDTGEFRWKVQTANCVHIGDVAGFLDKVSGYSLIRIDRHRYYAHRLAWLYMTGVWPIDQIDHINMNRADNRWTNLRAATRSENNANTGPHADNTSGLKGVSWDKRSGKWEASIKVNGKKTHLGYFGCPEAAHFAYVVAATDKAFGKFARFKRSS